jgi:hypothetical protein
VLYRSVDFGNASPSQGGQFLANLGVDPLYAGRRIEIRLDAPNGPLIGTLAVTATRAWHRLAPMSTGVQGVGGVHDVYLVGLGPPDGTLGAGAGVAVLDWFEFNRGAPPAPPTALVGNSQGDRVELRWQDNSGDETLMVVERSADGVNFLPIATLGANASRYTDVPPVAGVTYKYRVRAGNAFGLSSPSAAGAGTRSTRNPYALMPALDAYWGDAPVFPTPYTVGVPPGSHIAFLGVDFGAGGGAGASAVAVRMAAIYGSEGARVDLRLDDPSGPVIATLFVQASGSYGLFESVYAAVSGATGVHDVYLVPKDPNSGVNVAWMMFMQ